MDIAKELKQKYIPHIFGNVDTRRQLLARSRHIVRPKRRLSQNSLYGTMMWRS